jgi:hypothetical protein
MGGVLWQICNKRPNADLILAETGTPCSTSPYVLTGQKFADIIFRFVSFLHKMLIQMKHKYFRLSLLNINISHTWALTKLSFKHDRVSCCEYYLIVSKFIKYMEILLPYLTLITFTQELSYNT